MPLFDPAIFDTINYRPPPPNWTVGTVDLPFNPSASTDSLSGQIDEVDMDDSSLVLVSRYTKPRVFTLSGSLVAGTINTLEHAYLIALREAVGQQVTLAAPDAQYAGNWMFSQASFRREGGSKMNRCTYNLEFLFGKSNIILSSHNVTVTSLASPVTIPVYTSYFDPAYFIDPTYFGTY